MFSILSLNLLNNSNARRFCCILLFFRLRYLLKFMTKDFQFEISECLPWVSKNIYLTQPNAIGLQLDSILRVERSEKKKQYPSKSPEQPIFLQWPFEYRIK